MTAAPGPERELSSAELPPILLEVLARRRSCPVSLAAVMREAQLGELFVRQGKASHGAIARTGGALHPVLYRADAADRSALSARERFTVAHEIAHALLDGDDDARPLSTRAYWTLEGVCNEFAGRLLVPDDRLEKLTKATRDIRGLLAGGLHLSTETQTSLEVAFRRVCTELNDVQAMELSSTWSKKFGRPTMRVAWTSGDRHIEVDRGTHLIPDHWLVTMLQQNRSVGQLHGVRDSIEAACWRNARDRAIVLLRSAESPAEPLSFDEIAHR